MPNAEVSIHAELTGANAWVGSTDGLATSTGTGSAWHSKERRTDGVLRQGGLLREKAGMVRGDFDKSNRDAKPALFTGALSIHCM